MCCDIDMMVSTYRLEKPLIVHLPDGSSKQVLCVGCVRINKEIYLKEVMLIPEFIHNLLSVAQLIADSKANCTFLPKHCIIQK